MAQVLHIFRAAKRSLPMEELEQARVLENRGVEGCAHARPGGPRQILLVDAETLSAMSLPPGILRENITTEGLNVNGLRMGQQLRVGSARIEVSAVCTPCDQLERVRPGLRKELWGRRGMLCRVIEAGTIRRGDSIERLASVDAPAAKRSV
jgi:MOSC domain-containing protein YiiM